MQPENTRPLRVTVKMETWLEKFVWRNADKNSYNISDKDLLLSKEWLGFLNLSPFLKSKLYSLLLHIRNLREKTVIFPPENRVMAWSYLCHPSNVKVIILGQDPYQNGQATGCAFSVRRDFPIPPSLRNIFNELTASIPGFVPPSHGCLDEWGERGVLLLNAILTVESGKAASHADVGWQWFTNYVLATVSENLSHCVFMLWGSKAIEKAYLINANKHLVLKAQHPSPLAQCSHRSSNWTKFVGCGHFDLANKYLEAHNRGAINWRLD